MRSFLYTSLCLFTLNVGAQPIIHFDFNENNFTQTTKEIVANKDYTINSNFDKPERIPAIDGNALRLDGWSTFITTPEIDLSTITNALTIEAWFATEAFTPKSSAIFDYSGNNNELFLAINPVGYVNFNFKINGQVQFVVSSSKIEPYKWHHIVASIDPITNTASIYIDGKLDAIKELGLVNSIQVVPTRAFVGKRNQDQSVAGFSVNTLNGALDDLKVYNYSLTKETIFASFDSLKSNLNAALVIDPNIRYADDHLRPRYHVMPNSSWANETYGLIFHNSKYHMFFQKNPNAPFLYYMHWGHFSSPDLVTWTEEKIALSPSEGFSSFGVWSGTTITNRDSVPNIIYTGVDGAKAGIGIAIPLDDDLIQWAKKPTAVIPSPPTSIPNNDFRDPYVWKEGDTYWMIVGSGVKNNGGGILFTYTSTDLINWANVTPIFKSNKINESGVFWEMPFFNKITNNDYLLVVTPIFNGRPANCIYWVGTFTNGNFIPYDLTPNSFEHISEKLLAPSIQKDVDGQWAYIGIIPEDRNVADQIAAGWRQTFSIPRTLRLLDDKKTLAHVPHPNLCRARRNEVTIQNRVILPNSNFNIPEYKGTQTEIECKLYTKGVNQCYIQVYKNETGTEFTTLILDKALQRISINRYLSSPFNTQKDLRSQGYTFRTDDTIDVRIFLDHSTLEVFIDDLVVISSRIYPSKSSNNIDILTTNKALEIISFRAWDIGNKEVLFEDISCPYDQLPNQLYSSLQDFESANINTVIYPNPNSTGDYFIKLSGIENINNCQVQIFDLNGEPIKIFGKEMLNDTLKITLPSHISSTYFICRVSIGMQFTTFKLLKLN